MSFNKETKLKQYIYVCAGIQLISILKKVLILMKKNWMENL